MINTFNLLLVVITLITGILWIKKYYLFLTILFFRTKKIFKKFFKINYTNSINKKNHQVVNYSQPIWIEKCASFFPVLLIVLMIRSFIFEPFQIPSGSMMPTLLVGDFILVEKFSYGIKNPINNKTVFKTFQPNRGDIVVFKYPLNPSFNYIKRVIGIPGDRITYDFINKHIVIQPNFYKNRYFSTKKLSITYNNILYNDSIKTFNLTNNNSLKFNYFKNLTDNEKDTVWLNQLKESIEGMDHNILTFSNKQDQLDMYYQQVGCSLAEWIVPKGHYFMMGDNRDNSFDSRYWGFVPEDNLIGKAKIIWMSFEKKEGEWPTGIRFNRIGQIY